MKYMQGYSVPQLEHADLDRLPREEVAKAYQNGHCAALLGVEPDLTITHDEEL